MIFLRGLWKQKPQAWGPLQTVKSTLKDRFESLYGISWSKVPLVLPFWSPGKQTNYGNINGVYDAPTSYTNDYAYFSTATRIDITDSEVINAPLSEFSIFFESQSVAAKSAPLVSFNGTDDLLIYPNDTNSGDGGPRVFWRDCGLNIISINTADTADSFTRQCFSSKDNIQKYYTDGEMLDSSTRSITNAGPFTSFGVGGWAGGQYWSGNIKMLILSTVYWGEDVNGLMAENVYQLIQPPVFRTYFLPSGTPTIFNCAALHASKPTRIIQ